MRSSLICDVQFGDLFKELNVMCSLTSPKDKHQNLAFQKLVSS